MDKKRQVLEQTVKQIEKQFGKGAIMRLGERATERIPVISTGSLGLDLALGVGGYPRGRIIEIFGPEASGKTTLALHAIAEVQKAGGIAAFIDAEHALDPTYAKQVGVNIDDLYVSQPDTGEQALDIAELLVRSGAVDLVVVDSVAALVPRAEIEADMSEAQVGLQARLMSKAMRKLAGVLAKAGATAIFINQVRHKIGVFYGSPETTPGGLALKFHASVIVDVRRIATLKQGDQPVGNRVKAKVVKNKVAPPFREATFDILYGRGISKEGELLDFGLEMGLITRSGAWYSYKDQQLGQGRENARAFLEEHPGIAAEIEQAIRETFGLPVRNLEKEKPKAVASKGS